MARPKADTLITGYTGLAGSQKRDAAAHTALDSALRRW